MNLICHCDHVPCGAERVVRVRVRLGHVHGVRPHAAFTSQLAVDDFNTFAATLDAAGWKLVGFDRVLCPTHKDEAAR